MLLSSRNPHSNARSAVRTLTYKIREQIMEVRASGKANMCDCNAVQVVANEMQFYELVIYIEEHRESYFHFILTGETTA